MDDGVRSFIREAWVRSVSVGALESSPFAPRMTEMTMSLAFGNLQMTRKLHGLLAGHRGADGLGDPVNLFRYLDAEITKLETALERERKKKTPKTVVKRKEPRRVRIGDDLLTQKELLTYARRITEENEELAAKVDVLSTTDQEWQKERESLLAALERARADAYTARRLDLRSREKADIKKIMGDL